MLEQHTIVEAKPKSRTELEALMSQFVRTSFAEQGLEDVSEIEAEISSKMKLIENYFSNYGNHRSFYLLLFADEIIGAIAFNPASTMITDNLDFDSKAFPEVGSVFIKPEHQGLGLGKTMIDWVLNTIKSKGYQGYVLDSGYRKAQVY